MEEIKKEEIVKDEQEKIKNKRNTFIIIYILVGLFGIAILGMLLYAFIVTR